MPNIDTHIRVGKSNYEYRDVYFMEAESRSSRAIKTEEKVTNSLIKLERATKYEIAQDLNMSASTINDALDRLKLKGITHKEHIKEDTTKRGRPKSIWSLTGD